MRQKYGIALRPYAIPPRCSGTSRQHSHLAYPFNEESPSLIPNPHNDCILQIINKLWLSL